MKYLVSGKDTGLTVLGVLILILSGFLGVILFIVPLSLFSMKSKAYDLLVAIVGSLLWLIGLFVFFNVLWPSL